MHVRIFDSAVPCERWDLAAGVVKNMSGLGQRLGSFVSVRRDGPSGAGRDASAVCNEQHRWTATYPRMRQLAMMDEKGSASGLSELRGWISVLCCAVLCAL